MSEAVPPLTQYVFMALIEHPAMPRSIAGVEV
jgi:hypothetical protein